MEEDLILKHGGYKDLVSFKVSRLIFDITVRFCDKFISKGSRTHDQMVQAARSGVQNIAEGSQASGTSKETEIKLTNVARSSLEELRLDYEDFLRQRNLVLWERNDSRRQELVDKRFTTAQDFIVWVGKMNKNGQGGISEIAANGVLALINVACVLLRRQIEAQSDEFKQNGGFRERMYKVRKQTRK